MPAPAVLELERQVFLQKGIDVNRALPSVPLSATEFEREDAFDGVELEARRDLATLVPVIRAIPKGKGHKAKVSSAGSSMSWLDDIVFSSVPSRQHSTSVSRNGSLKPVGRSGHFRSLSSGLAFAVPEAEESGQPRGFPASDKAMLRMSSLRRPSDESIEGVLTPAPGRNRVVALVENDGKATPLVRRDAFEHATRPPLQSLPRTSSQALPTTFALPGPANCTPPRAGRSRSRTQPDSSPSSVPSPFSAGSVSPQAFAARTKSMITSTRRHVRAASESSAQVIGFAGKQAKEASGVVFRAVGKAAKRRGGDADEGVQLDVAVSQPLIVKHDLHVSRDFSGLPTIWREILSTQGVSQLDLDRISASRVVRQGQLASVDDSTTGWRMSKPEDEAGLVGVRSPDLMAGEYEVPGTIEVFREAGGVTGEHNVSQTGLGTSGFCTRGESSTTGSQGTLGGPVPSPASPLQQRAGSGGFPSLYLSTRPKLRVQVAGLGRDESRAPISAVGELDQKSEMRVIDKDNHHVSTTTVRRERSPFPLLRLSSEALDTDWAEEVIRAISRSKNRTTAEWRSVKLPSDYKRDRMRDRTRRDRQEKVFRRFQEERRTGLMA